MIRKYIMLLFVAPLLFTACTKGMSQEQRDAAILEVTSFYRIKASYEIIETGEPLDFDYIVSCYNNDVPGSFQGMIWPKTIFKATQAGQAVAVAVPDYYCSRRLRGEDLVQEKDLWKMPHLAWYPDVNDLSFAFVYASNDAYTGPKAKVRFKSYAAMPATQLEFDSWSNRTEADYVQIGAIPGPFGCTNFNVSSGKDPEACGHVINEARNHGKNISLPLETLYYVRALDWPEGYTQAARDHLGVKTARYRSVACLNPETGKKYERIITGRLDGELAPVEIRELTGAIRYLKSVSEKVYLDPELLLAGKGEGSIREVYPMIIHYQLPLNSANNIRGEDTSIYEVIRKQEWLGVAILTKEIGQYMPEFQRPKYEGPYISAIFLNGAIICDSASYGNLPNLYDLELGQTLSAVNIKPSTTNW